MLGIFLSLLINTNLYAERQDVQLRWKIPSEGYLAYKTSTSQLDPNEKFFEFDKSQIFKNGELPEEAKRKLQSLKLPSQANLTSILTPTKEGNISVKIIVGKIDFSNNGEQPDEVKDLFKKMEGTVQIRGEISEQGEITSFYLEQKQKNMIAMLFELPKRKVKEGDTWSLDVNLLMMGAGFIAKSADRVNKVTLKTLSPDKSNNMIAELEYLIAESVEGVFLNPMSGEEISTEMSMSFVGTGHFNVTEGRFEKMIGRLGIKSSGIMASENQQELSLEYLKSVPSCMLKLR